MGFLNKSVDENLRTMNTSARDDGTGNPITDVFVKGVDANGNETAIKVNANGELLTQLSGSKVVQLKSYKADTSHNGVVNKTQWYGETTGSGATYKPLDTSNYSTKMIRIKNNYNVKVDSVKVYLLENTNVGNLDGLVVIDVGELGAGESIFLSPHSHEQLSLPSVGLAVRVQIVANPTGNIDVNFFGSVNQVTPKLTSDYATPVEILYNNLTDDEAFPVKNVGKKINLRNVNADSSANVAVSGKLSMNVAATPGFVAKALNIYVSIPAPVGATTGEHILKIQTDTYSQVLNLKVPHNQTISIQRFEILTPVVNVRQPATDALLSSNVKDLRFTATMPLTFEYTNNTDASNNGVKTIRAFVEEEIMVL